MAKYWGIASAQGLESFIYEPSTGHSGFDEMFLDKKTEDLQKAKEGAYQAVYWNRHRHSVLYEVEMDLAAGKEIQKLADEDPVEALIMLKEKAKKIYIAKMSGSEKSWNLIPDPNLDPYR